MLSVEQTMYVRRIVKRAVLGASGKARRHWLVSGMAFGVDTEAVIAVWGLQPMNHIICTIPGTCSHNWGLAEQCAAAGAKIVTVPNKHTVGATYMARNDATVEHSEVLLAFPPTMDEELRSGTWATVRRARRAGVKVRYYPLDKAGE